MDIRFQTAMKKRKDPNVYPPGINARKVGEIIAYYDARHDADLLGDTDHELLHEPTRWVEVPIELVPSEEATGPTEGSACLAQENGLNL